MKNKTVFTRESARRNVAARSFPPYIKKQKTTCELNTIVDQYSQLLLKPGWGIYSRDGRVYAEFLGAAQTEEDIMRAIRGDESPLSYLQAAVCYHHLREYSDQKTNVLANAIIDDDYIRTLDLFGGWRFGELERSLNPIFFYDSLMHPAVIFFTFHQEGTEVIEKHVHRFAYEGYMLKTLQRTWAIGS